MIRALRRFAPDEPDAIAARTALEYETCGNWPTASERHRFWNAARIPSHLRERNQPDPRAVLGEDAVRQQFERDMAYWKSARLQWLKEAARG